MKCNEKRTSHSRCPEEQYFSLTRLDILMESAWRIYCNWSPSSHESMILSGPWEFCVSDWSRSQNIFAVAFSRPARPASIVHSRQWQNDTRARVSCVKTSVVSVCIRIDSNKLVCRWLSICVTFKRSCSMWRHVFVLWSTVCFWRIWEYQHQRTLLRLILYELVSVCPSPPFLFPFLFLLTLIVENVLRKKKNGLSLLSLLLSQQRIFVCVC